jgi:hypothetical protein
MTGRRRARCTHVAAGLVAVLALALSAPAMAATDNAGTNFWVTFPGNNGASTLTLTIAAAKAASGSVSAPGLMFSEAFTVAAGSSTTVTVPGTAALQTVAVENRGVHVTANGNVTVTGLNRQDGSSDGFLAFPVDALGTDHRVLAYPNNGGINGTQFGIVAPSDNTAVTITPSATTNGHAAGTPFVVDLNQGQTYLLRESADASADLSGTRIQSTKPVAVFGGHVCANVPSAGTSFCDHLVEQLPPVAAWGRHFVQVPLATRDQDSYRVLGLENGTSLTWTPSTPPGAPTSGNAGSVNDYVTAVPVELNASKPVLLMQFAQGSGADAVPQSDTDPFQAMVPPVEQWLSEYVITTPTMSFSNHLNLAVPTSSVGQVTIDGNAISAGAFTAIVGSAYSVAQVPIGIGPHKLAGPAAFGASLYGWAMTNEAYGYVAGAGAAPIGTIGSLALSPKATTAATDSSFCPVATVRDASQNPVAAVSLDFTVTGANATGGSAVTGSDGQASLCFVHPNTGDSAITARIVNFLTDSATVTWTAPATPPSALPGTTPITTPGPLGPPSTLEFSARVPRKVRLASFVCGVVRKVKCNGLAVNASTPGPGGIVLQVAALKGKKSIALGKLSRRATRAGALKLVFKVKSGRRASKLYRSVKKARAKKLRVVASFAPASGTPARVTRTVVLSPR